MLIYNMVFTYSFPVSNSSVNVYLGQAIISANTTNPPQNIIGSVPISFIFSGNKTSGQASIWTVSLPAPIICNVYKNSVFLTTCPITIQNSIYNTTKSFSNPITNGPFNLNSYFYNINFTYQASAPVTTDTYQFYAQIR